MAVIKAAAVQVGSRLFDLDGTLDVFRRKLDEVSRLGVDLAVFPEAFLGGYPKGIDFGVRVGLRSAEGRDQFRAYYESAVERQSAEMEQVRELVRDAGLTVIVGLIERDAGTLYCASCVITPDGEVASWHRKLMPTAMERVIWGQGDGSTMAIAETHLGKLSMAICWENYMPLYRAHLYAQGTQIHCVPTVDDRTVWLPSMQMIALEGRCFVVSACQVMRRSNVAADWFEPVQGSEPETMLIRGGSCIISPLGEVLADPVYDEEAIVIADLDLDEIARGKFDLDVTGHYARPDVFKLQVTTG